MKPRVLFLLAASGLVTVAATAQQAPARVIEGVRDLATARVTLDLCLRHPDARTLADATRRHILAISKRIDRLANDIHESAKGKLLYVSYSINVTGQTRSGTLRKTLTEQPGGVCDFRRIEAVESELGRTERLIRQHL